MEGCFEGRDVEGIFGTAGMIGSIFKEAGRPEKLFFGVVCCDLFCSHGVVGDGVVGWVEKASDGGCDVSGVPKLLVALIGPLRGAGISVSASEASSPGCDKLFSGKDALLFGSSTGSVDDWGNGCLRRRDFRGGSSPPNVIGTGA